ncbi:MAG: hypothetical protein AAFY91_06610, partial [Bacteroidota bacterium]
TKLDEANFYTFGIGRSVNRHLIEGLARVGRGQSFVLTDPSEAPEIVDRFRRYIESPVLTGLEIQFDRFDAYDVEPLSVPDLTSERPLVVFGKYRGRPRGRIELCGYGGYSGEVPMPIYEEQAVPPAARQRTISYTVKPSARSVNHGALQYLWARERLRRLSDYAGLGYGIDHREEIVALGLEYNLLTQFTSFVAVEHYLVANTEGESERVEQALPLPQDVSDMAVGFDLGLRGMSGLPDHAGKAIWKVLIISLSSLLLLLVLLWRYRNRLSRYIIPTLLFGCLVSCSSEEYSRSHIIPETPEPATTSVGSTLAAHTITYILGEDEGNNAYYDRAAVFFRQDSQWESAVVETEIRSIGEMVADLRKSKNQNKWQRINIVVHGNQWTGLAVAPGGSMVGRERTDAQALADLREQLSPLPHELVDSQTEVVLHGCSTGKDTSLLLALSALLGNDRGEYPVVASSPAFSLFRQASSSPQPRLQLAEYYFVAAPLRQWPSREALADELTEKYPNARVDWTAALGRNRFSQGDAPLLYQFNVPIDWLDIFAPDSELPQPAGQVALQHYAASIDQLKRELHRLELTVEDFAWQSEPSAYTTATGQAYPALALQGQSRVFCILQPLSGTADPARYTRLRYTAEAR